MKSFKIGVAGRVIEINSMFTRVYNICKDYMVEEGTPVISIQCTMKDFDKAAERFEVQNSKPAPCDVYLEESAVLEKLSEALINHDAILIHGAAICYNNNAFLFTGRSGVGKTTHIRKWLENCPDSFVVNGDKPFLWFSDKNQAPLVCGSPWNGKEGFGTNTMVPLKAVVLLSRAEDNSIYRISFSEAFPFLYAQIYRAHDAQKMRRVLDMLRSMNGTVSFYKFNINNFKEDCFQTAFQTLVEGDTT